MFRELYTTYEQNKDLISLGAYRQGSDNKIDSSIAHREPMMEFLRQPLDTPTDFESDLVALQGFADAVDGGSGSPTSSSVPPETMLVQS